MDEWTGYLSNVAPPSDKQTGSLLDRTGHSWMVFDIDCTREAARQRAYARGLLDFKNGRCDDLEDIARIGRGHRASTLALERQANCVLFCDTDLLTTTVWSNVLFGSCPSWLYEAADFAFKPWSNTIVPIRSSVEHGTSDSQQLFRPWKTSSRHKPKQVIESAEVVADYLGLSP